MKKVYREINEIEEVGRVEMLTGPYDVMAIAEGAEIRNITDALIEKIRGIKGVQDTSTNIFIKA